jgi:shikimate dehydrogenase
MDLTFSGGRCAPDAATRLYCVIGDPAGHSKSPAMHNAAFAKTGVNAVYCAFRVTDAGAAMAAVRALGIAGVSVTVPHKVAVMACLDEVDEAARAIGAVNTVKNENGRLLGKNTDAEGAVRALEEAGPLAGKTVAVLGAGGAARAVVFGALGRGARVVVVNRTREKGRALAREAGADFLPLSRARELIADVVVNTTTVGMAPSAGVSPAPPEIFRPGMAAMDIVYNPLRTRFLEDARQKGCSVVDGLAMFVYQGASQFEWWTGLPAPADEMRRAVEGALGG